MAHLKEQGECGRDSAKSGDVFITISFDDFVWTGEWPLENEGSTHSCRHQVAVKAVVERHPQHVDDHIIGHVGQVSIDGVHRSSDVKMRDRNTLD